MGNNVAPRLLAIEVIGLVTKEPFTAPLVAVVTASDRSAPSVAIWLATVALSMVAASTTLELPITVDAAF